MPLPTPKDCSGCPEGVGSDLFVNVNFILILYFIFNVYFFISLIYVISYLLIITGILTITYRFFI